MPASILASLDELLSQAKQNCQYDAIIEDWQAGLQVRQQISGSALLAELKELRERYGDRFSFRLFNKEHDLHWNGELGIVATDGDVAAAVTIPLIADTKTHKAAAATAQMKLNARRLACGYLRFCGFSTTNTHS